MKNLVVRALLETVLKDFIVGLYLMHSNIVNTRHKFGCAGKNSLDKKFQRTVYIGLSR